MVRATIELIFEGELPSSSSIAERAGVTQRTLFNQFGDMDTLIMEVARRQGDAYLDRAPSIDLDAPLRERATAMVSSLATVLEDAMHVRWAVLRSGNPLALELVESARTWVRGMVEDTFAAELDAVVAPRRIEVVDELEMALDPIAWRMRRTVQGLSAEEATVRVTETVVALLSSP